MSIIQAILSMTIVVSFVFYIYYKVVILRTKEHLMQHYFNAKSRICLGIFMTVFGLNQYLFYQTKLALLITFIFIFIGALQLNRGIKETRHYKNEWERLKIEHK